LLVQLEPDAGASGGNQGRWRRRERQKEGFMKQSEAGIASNVFQGERRQFVRLDLL